jgi:AcrR family transcriptional regulator
MRTGILKIAREMLRDQGAMALNLNEIARQLGATTPALYTYFPGKASLYDELYRIGIGLLIDAENDLQQSTTPDWVRIERWFQLRVDFADAHSDLYHLIFDAPVPGFNPSPESLEQISVLYRAVAQNIEEVIASGAMAPNLPLIEATDLLISMRLGIVASHLGKQRQLPTAERLDQLVPSIVQVLRVAWEPRHGSP